MSSLGLIVGTLILSSFILPWILIPLFDLWNITIVLLVLLGIIIIVLSIFWYRENKKENLSLTAPAVSIGFGVLIIIIAILLFIFKRTRIPQLAKLAISEPTISKEECIENYSTGRPNGDCFRTYPDVIEVHDECKGLLDRKDFTGETDPELFSHIQRFQNCRKQCLRTDPSDECFENCDRQSECFKFPDLKEQYLAGSLNLENKPVVGSLVFRD